MKSRICLSHILDRSTPAYGGTDGFYYYENTSIFKGDSANTSCWVFSNNHIGTHIDSPYHFDSHGPKSFELNLDKYFFNCVSLIDIPCDNGRLLYPDDINPVKKRIKKKTDILLIRTGYERYRKEKQYWEDNPGISNDLGNWIKESYPFIRCIGFDFISLSSWKHRDEGRKCHKILLNPIQNDRSILIIEDMALEKITCSITNLILAPLFVIDGNGGPVTVFAEMQL